ncbi:MAG TPA: FHA domain-containing protein [Gemmataceae bacterium]|jgi:hypothetical protein|nr:FHA domain-containing protein [Gemmataceae bacterium]
MVKCPFCQYDNEEGALFCEQCKSDLGGAQPAAASQPREDVPVAAVIEETAAFAPVADVVEPLPLEATPVGEGGNHEQADAGIPMAAPVADEPPLAFAPEPEPVAIAPLAEAAPAGPQPAAQAAPPAAEAGALPAGAQPRLVVLRGQKLNVEYPIYEGHNFIGRADEKPVDIDLEDQEPPDRIWSSRQHALVSYEEGKLLIEDLNSSNGTFVNRTRIYPGQKRPLAPNDVIQIGTVQMKVKV